MPARTPISPTAKLALVLAAIGVVFGAVWLVGRTSHAIGTVLGPHQGAKVRLVEHHCSTAKDGSALVNAQLANDGKTGRVQASAYALLYGGKIANADGWQYESSIPAGSSDFFAGKVALSPGDQVIGCGVLLGEGAPHGVSYEPAAG